MPSMKSVALTIAQVALLVYAGWCAYDIRMHAIRTFGLVIHEFDPWFNFRATQYLADNGFERFFKWYDYMSWSPLGRPVGTTIYPGMQIIAVLLWRAINATGFTMSLNDVCCYVPVIFGVVASMLIGGITSVVTNSRNAGLFAAACMSVIPAHIMRSVGGGYDNESVAISCLCLTFLCWTYSLSGKDDSRRTFFGIITGLAYICMVAAWGGYIFVLNLIGLHAFILICLGRFSNKLYWAYSLWYIVGTLGAIQIPVVGLAPLKSLEQLAPAGVFVMMQLLQLSYVPAVVKFFKFNPESITTAQRLRVQFQLFAAAGVVGAGIVAVLWPRGYFGPLSSRVRGLFVTHTRTGNPLVDSVAEHQPASPQAFWQFLHYTCYTSPIGFVIALFSSVIKPFFKPPAKDANSTDPMVFVVVYAAVSYHFSTKMNRLMLLMGPISAICTGIAIDWAVSFVISESSNIYNLLSLKPAEEAAASEEPVASTTPTPKGGKKKGGAAKTTPKVSSDSTIDELIEAKVSEMMNTPFMKYVKMALAAYFVYTLVIRVPQFYAYSRMMAVQLSGPSLMFQARLRDGTPIIVDDYREAYWWVRDNTPEDARIMAWWDYGYQITGIANRTTIADGNTWNHEHIALLGRCLTSPEKKAHNIIKHLADYVLIWSGGGGDDLAKSPHMARISNSVYDDLCPDDPTCSHFGFYEGQVPTPMMAESLLYKLHRHNSLPGVKVDSKLFKEVFRSKYDMVRVFQVVGVSQESKEFISNPANRKCDYEGSWHCKGQYPPALEKLLSRKKDFKQLEDFNVDRDEKSNKYHEDYMRRIHNQGPPPSAPPGGKRRGK